MNRPFCLRSSAPWVTAALCVLLMLAPLRPALAQDQGDAPKAEAKAEPDKPAAAKPEPAKPEPGRNGSGKSEEHGGGPGLLALLPGDSVTEHTLNTDIRTLSYTATAGTDRKSVV